MILWPPQEKLQALTISNCWKRNNLATSCGIVREKTFQASSGSSWLQRFLTQVTETGIKIVSAPWAQKVWSLLEVTYNAQMSCTNVCLTRVPYYREYTYCSGQDIMRTAIQKVALANTIVCKLHPLSGFISWNSFVVLNKETLEYR